MMPTLPVKSLVSIGAMAMCAAAFGDPVTRSVTYQLHATPSDANSPVTYVFDLSLKAVETTGSQVGWQIYSLGLEQLDPNGAAAALWLDSNPAVDTADGLWWVDGSDAATLADEAFVEPPLVDGTAVAADPNEPDMDYQFKGNASAPPVYATTASLDYFIDPSGQSTPQQEGDDEPVELPPSQQPLGGE